MAYSDVQYNQCNIKQVKIHDFYLSQGTDKGVRDKVC